MSNISWKNLSQYFSNFNCTSITPSPPSTIQDHINSPTPPLFKNFNSLYTLTSSSSSYFSPSSSTTTSSSPPPDFASAFASQRFFISSPGPSNSILHSPLPPSSSPLLSDGGAAAIPTYSADPYTDFRRSMEEMVEARGLTDVKGEWDFLHELLLCYLSLNPKCAHQIIIRAFSDLIVSLTAFQ
ncbi:hypothetical protein LguiA_030923 [Lonicera macranthoides]